MARASLIGSVGAALAAAACTATPPPAELDGLWSANRAACDAGVGVRFGTKAIEIVYARQTETLFDQPRYVVERGGESFRVRITYRLPRPPGGTRVVGSHGVLVLARREDGGIAPVAHTLVDGRTGAARLRFVDDPAVRALTLEPCAARHPWREGLRGRTRT